MFVSVFLHVPTSNVMMNSCAFLMNSCAFCCFFQLDDRALDAVMKKLFKSYKMWCKYLGRKSSLW